MTQKLSQNDPRMITLVRDWYEIGTRLVRDWYEFGTSLVRVWDEFGTSLRRVWDEFEEKSKVQMIKKAPMKSNQTYPM